MNHSQEWLNQNFSWNLLGIESSLRRVLAGAAPDDISLDYSIFSVGFTVLALILVVEIARHKLDHYAIHKPLVKAIIGACYRELSTLGIVELFIFLLHKYGTVNAEMEYVFAQFHFMLFFVAIFNALVTSLMAKVSASYSRAMWVQSEEVELEYYMGLRAEYDRVVSKLEEKGIEHLRADRYFTDSTLHGFFRNMQLRITYPRLVSQYKKLVLPIRFHEMRVHFLMANDLPKSFKVSQYLKRCELHALKNFAHVHMFSWLGLMAGFNLLYYSLGIVELYHFESKNAIVYVLNYILLFGCYFCVLLCLVILKKVKMIFNTIMTAKFIERKCNEENDEKVDSIRSNGIPTTIELGQSRNQLELFWNSNPNLITLLIQSIQFYYCIVASFLLIFWDSKIIDEKSWHLATVLAASCFVCYLISLLIVANALPIFIMCTSLGQLSNRHRLSEARAMYRLDVLKKKRLYQYEQKQLQSKLDIQIGSHSPNENGPKESSMSESKSNDASTEKSTVDHNSSDSDKSKKLGVEMERKDSIGSDGNKSEESKRLEQLSSMVLMTSNQLQSKFNDSNSTRSNRINERRKLRKTRSEGVKDMVKMESMRDMILSTTSSDSISSKGSIVNSKPKQPREKGWRKKSTSTGVDFMRTEEKVPNVRTMMRTSSSNALPTLLEDIPSRSMQIMEFKTSSRKLDTSLSNINLAEFDTTNDSLEKNSVADDKATSTQDTISSFDIDDKDVDLPDIKIEVKAKSFCYVTMICNFCRSKQYRVFSYAFGTLPCFFLVGMRMEGLLTADGRISVSTNTWNLSLGGAFALEFFWLCCFIIISSTIIALFSYGPGYSFPKRYHMIIAAVYDIIISSLCLILLLVAEAKRCCDRPYGSNPSIGGIEPFTGIIFLRVFRFYLATKTYKIWRRKRGIMIEKKHIVKRGSIYMNENQSLAPEQVQKLQINSTAILSKSGTVLELWNSAVSSRPDIVAAYGEFSGEMLQAMLGLPVDTKDMTKNAVSKSFFNKYQVKTILENDDTKIVGETKEDIPLAEVNIEKRYAHLRSDVQEVICAGKVGKPVKLVDHSELVSNSKKGIRTKDNSCKVCFKYNESELKKEDLVEFEVDEQDFLAPNAQLIRNLRRCEYRLLPALPRWNFVDVAITKYEIVLFEVTNDDNEFSANYSFSLDEKEVKRKVCVHEAIVATKGGKGLMLRDIAFGRNVVGRISMKDVTSSTIERYISTENSPENVNDLLGRSLKATNKSERKLALKGKEDSNQGVKIEYWKEDFKIESDFLSRQARWERIQEDQLNVHSINDTTLVLRFLNDINKVESDKSQSLIWCQTIIRLCDPKVLDQHIPHLGEELEEVDLVHIGQREIIAERKNTPRMRLRKQRSFFITGEIS